MFNEFNSWMNQQIETIQDGNATQALLKSFDEGLSALIVSIAGLQTAISEQYPSISLSPSKYPTISICDRLRDRLGDRHECGDRANTALERYFWLLDSAPQLSGDEWELLKDACNNSWATHLESPEDLKSVLLAQVKDAIAFKDLDKKWQTDRFALIARLQAMSSLEVIATVVNIESLPDDVQPE